MPASVRWDPAQASLVDASGAPLSDAQDAKARRYVAGNHIAERQRISPDAAWGQAWREIRVYELSPIPGCRQLRQVTVTIHHDGQDRVVRVDYECDCQFAQLRSRACSHVLAVHRWRRDRIGNGCDAVQGGATTAPPRVVGNPVACREEDRTPSAPGAAQGVPVQGREQEVR